MSSQPIVSRPSRAIRELTLADSLREAENHFWELFVRPSRALLQVPEMKLDLSEDDKSYQIKADVPGVKKEDIKVKIDGNLVSIGAEIRKDQDSGSGKKVISSERASSQYRVFTLAQDIDAEKAEAKYQDGVLELTLPKKPGAKVTDVPVK
jgi:HSP20 family protein